MEDTHQYTRNSNTGQHTAQYFRTEQETHNDGGDQCNRTRCQHLADRSFGRNFNTLFVFRLCFVFHDTWNFAELSANFVHHVHRSATHSSNCQRREDEWNHSTHKQTSQYWRFVNINRSDTRDTHESSKQCQRSQGSRSNRKTFTRCSSGVTNRIQIVCTSANFLGQLTHFSDTTCVVSDRTESVNGQLHRSSRHHTGSGDRYTIQTSEVVRTHDTTSQNQDWQYSRFHTHTQTTDDVGSVASSRLTDDRHHRAFAHGSIVFGDDTHQSTHDQSYDDGSENTVAGEIFTTNSIKPRHFLRQQVLYYKI